MARIHRVATAVLAVALAGAVPLGAQQAPAPGPATAALSIFVRSALAGAEEAAVERSADGWTITASGRFGTDVVTRRLQVRYDEDWHARELTLDGTVRGVSQSIHTVIAGTTATSTIVVAGAAPVEKVDTIPADAVLLPNPIFSAYEAVAARLRTATAGSTIPAYVVPQGAMSIRVGESTTEQIQTVARLIRARRTHIELESPNARPLEAELWTDERSRLLRLSIPVQSLEVAREDIASVSARRITVSHPGDERVNVPANGFSLAGTLSKPADAGGARLPAVVLVGGSGPTDRDETVAGIPVLGQLANALADAGYLVLRYDRRGVGQSGGRPETATLADFAEDLRAAVKFLADRKNVDPKRIAVVGHSEGGWVALLAAAKDRRIGAVVLVGTAGTTGADLILAQQKHALDKTTLSEADKQAKIDLQKRIHQAAISGKGRDALPLAIQQQIDNEEFRSLLTFDPARVMRDVSQPLLILQGDLDAQVEPSNADRLGTLANTRKNKAPAEVVKVPGINHLLVPATTGEVDEYPSLKEKAISPAAASAIASWLQKAFSAKK